MRWIRRSCFPFWSRSMISSNGICPVASQPLIIALRRAFIPSVRTALLLGGDLLEACESAEHFKKKSPPRVRTTESRPIRECRDLTGSRFLPRKSRAHSKNLRNRICMRLNGTRNSGNLTALPSTNMNAAFRSLPGNLRAGHGQPQQGPHRPRPARKPSRKISMRPVAVRS